MFLYRLDDDVKYRYRRDLYEILEFLLGSLRIQ